MLRIELIREHVCPFLLSVELGPPVRCALVSIRATCCTFRTLWINDASTREAAITHTESMIRFHAGIESRGKERGKMMFSMLDMDEVTIEAVMTHRGAVTMIDSKEDPELIFKVVGESPFTRIPIYSGNPDNIIGILHAKELFRNLRRRNFKNINSIKFKFK